MRGEGNRYRLGKAQSVWLVHFDFGVTHLRMRHDQVKDFLENGNIHNSVNFPNLVLERTNGYRLALANRNVPRILGSVLSILAYRNINVIDMLNKSREDVAYNLIDVEVEPTPDLVRDIEKIEGVINVRVFP